jgi:hypothetical protein
MRSSLSKMNPSTLFDLQKFHPKAWDHFLDFKNEFIKGQVRENIVKGQSEGFYRKEIDPDILATFRVEQVQMIFDHKVFNHEVFDFLKVQMQLFDHFVHGLLTEKGKALYKQFLQEEKNMLK